ncbi:CBU_0592 family membrane protein [Cochlodiniinecator piscidefendens]|uniref:CBU_0592 family membrane protein n=1 Tax=Cochlodiniinecator piscidefendens TaxID=2715756 RepID=UPI00197BEF0B|nr:hypothetical protein [Cochlodiniinecator piscidefendens]
MDFLSETSPFFADVTLSSLGILDVIGVVGFGLYLTNYTLVTFQKIDSRGITFFLVNIIAASCVLTSLVQNFNLASALIQIFWICLGVVAVTLRLLPGRQVALLTESATKNSVVDVTNEDDDAIVPLFAAQ